MLQDVTPQVSEVNQIFCCRPPTEHNCLKIFDQRRPKFLVKRYCQILLYVLTESESYSCSSSSSSSSSSPEAVKTQHTVHMH